MRLKRWYPQLSNIAHPEVDVAVRTLYDNLYKLQTKVEQDRQLLLARINSVKAATSAAATSTEQSRSELTSGDYTIRPESFSDTGTNAVTTPSYAMDGSVGTAATITGDNSGNAQGAWYGFSFQEVETASVRLYIDSTTTTTGTPPTATVEYSTNGGSSWVTVYSTSTERGRTTDQVSLSATQNISQVQVRVTVAIGSTPGDAHTVNLVDAWIEITA